MSENPSIAIVGVGAILPDAPDVQTFWKNIQASRYSITDVAADRWKADLFYSPDPSAPDKTYSKVGGWVRGFIFEPVKMGIAIPPRILEQIDETQQWAISACYQALKDYGYPSRSLDPDRVAVILGNAMAGEKHYLSTIRIHLPEYIDSLSASPAFQNLSADIQSALIQGLSYGVQSMVPAITEDTMPGELSNIIAGRVANVFNFTGPNFVTDAACASSLAALQSAIDGLRFGQFDAVLTGGVDRNMGVESFVKFSKIGALSPDGSRPYAEGANGFVMGEGTAIFLLKRLVDAERDGDKVYAVIRAIGGSSDGKGKGITAPNPLGQQRAIQRAWKNAAIPLSSVGLIEGHGTSTPVGDLAEVTSLNTVFGQYGLKPGSVALGSVKSNFGHLKSAAGAAGMLKATLALYDHILPPSANFDQPNSKIDFSQSPFYVNTQTHPWEVPSGEVRRAGVSAFGFGGTNFHVILEEYLPGALTRESAIFPGADLQVVAQAIPAQPVPVDFKPYRGLFFLGAESASKLSESLTKNLHQAKLGHLPENTCPSQAQLSQPERLVIDYENLKEFIPRVEKALKALETDVPAGWQALGVQGIYRGSGRPGKVAFLFPGQGSQYVNMLRDLRTIEPLVAETFREADAVMTPILGRTISSYVFVDGKDDAITQAELRLRSTEITQPALLAVHVSLLRVLAKYGFKPDMVIGHSLGEYAALVASGILSLSEALQVVSARGQEMAKVAADDNGCMAAVSAPLVEVERILKTIQGYVVIANINSPVQSVIGGETASVDAAIAAFLAEGLQATKIPVSHAFHTRIVAPASQPLRKVIARMNIQAPKIPIVANVNGKLYPTGHEEILDILAAQVASPVQFVQGVTTLYEQGARIFVEVGPKRVLSGLTADILKERKDVTVFSTNHPRKGDIPSINEALGRLYAAGVTSVTETMPAKVPPAPVIEVSQPVSVAEPTPIEIPYHTMAADLVSAQGGAIMDGRLPLTGSVVISGAGLGLPGRGKHVFDDNNILDILKGEMRIEPLPNKTRQGMLDKKPTRLVKSEAGAIMQTIDDMELTLKLAGQRGTFDPVTEFGMPQDRLEAIDISTQLAIAAGIEALRDAGIPLIMAYKQTSTGSYLPDRWKLPESLADETGIIFASAFPGLDRMADEADKYYQSQMVVKQIEELRRMAGLVPAQQTDLKTSFEKRIAELEVEATRLDYHFDRRYIFRVLTMGHSQFAEYIGARGPNTHVNAACASTTHAVAIAEDWIRLGRARRVIIIAGDDVISGSLSQWIGTSLMASGAATPEGNLRMAALPFDRRRNGMIIGMGAAALVVESEDAVRERGMHAICEVLSSVIANSAFHGTRLNVNHVSQVMETLLKTAEGRFGISRSQIAGETMFVSHETYTPARGGSATAEIHALRGVFGEQANQVIIANTKGFTGHTMGVGVEDVVAVKALEYGIVPPIAHIQNGFEPDPELGDLNLSRGGKYPVQFSLRLGAGFGSQIAMTLLRKVPGQSERVDDAIYKRWLSDVSGYPTTELEISQRTLHIKNQGVPTQKPVASRWQFGQGPTLWATKLPATSNTSTSLPQPVAPPVAAQPAEKKSQPFSTQPTDTEEIRTFVLSVVSEKTGYPIEVLDLDLDLEADLGIDTVKQAELFAAIRGQYGIARREDLRLSDYNTLAKVISFVQDALGSTSTPVAAPQPVLQADDAPIAIMNEPMKTETPVNPSTEEIKAYVLSAVSEKTGYPAEVLDLDLDLEADLGIDTVKQAELFASIRGQFDIPRREDLRLSDYNTLAKVMAFVEVELKALNETAEKAAMPTPAQVVPSDLGVSEVQASIVRRVPVPSLRPRLDLCIPTGVKLGEGQRVLVVESMTKTADALARKLTTRKVKVLRLSARLGSEVIAEKLSDWLAEGPIAGVYFLPALEIEPKLAEMSAQDWQAGLEERLYSLYTIMKALPEETFLVCATRLGGLHGYSAEGASAPLGGAVSGFAKAVAREREKAFVKIVDFETSVTPTGIATCLIDETLVDPGALEIGWENDLRYGIATVDQPLPAEKNFTLEQGSVFLISGGSGGIIRPIVEDLVRATCGTFYLLDRVSLPAADDPDIIHLASDREGLKNELITRLTRDGKKPTPVQVEGALFSIERSATTLQTLGIIEQLGGKAHYLACDVTNPGLIDEAIQKIKDAEGHIDAFLHAAGMERSRKLEMKPIEEFRLVVSVKADGFFNLFKAMESKGILPRGMVFFSSVAGRFGNSGQTDYSAANDLLCKITSAIRNQYPKLKAVAIDWSAWGGVGMATRGNIPTLMKLAGIDLVPPEQAAPMVRAELLSSTGEAIIAGSLGALLEMHCPHGGMDLVKADSSLRTGQPVHSMLSHVADFDLNRGLTLEAELDPKTQPFLYDHTLNGTPVLPGVMGIEGFSVAAKHIGSMLASNKGRLEVGKLEDIHFLATFKFYRKEPRRVTWMARGVREEAGLVFYVSLESSRTIKPGSDKHIKHFSGKVTLKSQESEMKEVSARSPRWNGSYTVQAEDIYRLYFHGPAFQVLEGVQRAGDTVLGKLNKRLPSITSEEHALLSTPTLVELCFQTAGIWEIGKTGIMALPSSIESLTLYRQNVNGATIYAEVKPIHSGNGELHFDARVVDSKGRLYLELKEYRTTPMPVTVEPNLLAPLKELMEDS
jgi:malonyl CoA-acyl carrier protein transacylase